MKRRLNFAILAIASSAALVAGCGGSSSGGGTGTTTGGTGTNNSSQTPGEELTGAFSALGKASTLTTTLQFGAGASAGIGDLVGSSGSTLTQTQLDAIAGAQISVEVQAPSGKSLSDLTSGGATGAAVDFKISDNGTDFLTVRSVDKVLYLQTDLKDLFDAIGQGSTYATLQGSVAQLPTFVQALFQGKWVSLPQSAAAGLTGGTTSSGSSPSTQQEQAIIDGLKKILADDVTVTRSATGSTDTLSLSANSRTIATDFVATVTAAVPSAAAALGSADPSTVPSKDITLGAQVTGGALSQLSIDLGQFDPQGKGHLPLEINFSQSGSAITKPSGAVAVNTQELGQLFSSFAGGFTGGGTGG
jgi:hypothetical protein